MTGEARCQTRAYAIVCTVNYESIKEKLQKANNTIQGHCLNKKAMLNQVKEYIQYNLASSKRYSVIRILYQVKLTPIIGLV